LKFPDPNIGYVCGYNSKVTNEALLVTFLGGIVQIPFKFNDIESIYREVYRGGRISWDVIRWGKCPSGKDALRIFLKRGSFRNHIIVFDNLEETINKLRSLGVNIINCF